jgi:hypothetical protein
MKTFIDSYEPVRIKIQDIKGNEKVYETTHINVDVVEKINTLVTSTEIIESEKMKQVCSVFFQKDPDEFNLYSLKILTQVFKYVVAEIKKKSETSVENLDLSGQDSVSASDSKTSEK